MPARCTLPSLRTQPRMNRRRPHTTPTPADDRRGLLCAAVLCLAVWGVACMFFGGDLGWWNDDYWFFRRPFPDQASVPFFTLQYTPFEPATPGLSWWRPLFLIVAPIVTTACWDAPWVLHAFDALLHLTICALTYQLLRALRISPRAAVVATLLLVVCAPASEMIFWAACTSSLLACTCLLACFLCFARGVQTARPAWFVAAVLLGMPIPLLNEQPAACFLALPLIALAARPRDASHRRALLLATPAILALALWCAVYLAAIFAHPAGPDRVGAAGSLIPLHRAAPVLGKDIQWLWRIMAEWHFLRDSAVGVGADALSRHPVRTVLFAAIILPVGVTTLRWLCRPESPPAPATTPHHPRRAAVFFLGILVMVSALLPIMAVDAPVRPRMTYLPWLGLCIAVAACTDAARHALRTRPVLLHASAWATASVLAWILGMSMVAMVGVQASYHERSRIDQRLADQLRRAMPNPKPGTVFFAMRVDDWPSATRNPHFDHFLISPVGPAWSFPTFARHVYQRSDVNIASMHWEQPRFAWADRTTVVPTVELPDAFQRDPLPEPLATLDARRSIFSRHQAPIRWDRIVPIEVLEDGSILAIKRLSLRRAAEGEDARFYIDPPRVRDWQGPTINIRGFDIAPLPERR